MTHSPEFHKALALTLFKRMAPSEHRDMRSRVLNLKHEGGLGFTTNTVDGAVRYQLTAVQPTGSPGPAPRVFLTVYYLDIPRHVPDVGEGTPFAAYVTVLGTGKAVSTIYEFESIPVEPEDAIWEFAMTLMEAAIMLQDVYDHHRHRSALGKAQTSSLRSVEIVHRSGLRRTIRGTPLEGITSDVLSHERLRCAELALFLAPDAGLFKVLKNVTLGCFYAGGRMLIPNGVIVPMPLLGDLLSGRLDLNSPGVIKP